MLMVENEIVSGYRLIDKGNFFEFHHKSGKLTGTFNSLCKTLVHDYEFTMTELLAAKLTMEEKFHNCAEFGMFKSFMFTHDINIYGSKITYH